MESAFGDFEGPDGIEVPMFEHRKGTSKLTTSGLTNCVAIVAYHRGSGEAVLWHLNTIELFVQDVTVNVFNASKREGLAARTMAELLDDGFAAGRAANAPKGTSLTDPAEIWVTDADDPGAKLLRRRVGPVPVVEHPESSAPGVTLVVGDGFTELRRGPKSVVLDSDAVVCSPPVE